MGSKDPTVSWNRKLIVAFTAVALSFSAASAFTHWRLMAIDRAAVVIATNAAPSVERLSAARGALRQMQLLLAKYVDDEVSGARPDPEPVLQLERAMNQALADYQSLPAFPGERALSEEMGRTTQRLNDAVARCRSAVQRGDSAEATTILETEVSARAEALAAAMTNAVELNAWHSHNLALTIVRTRSRCMWLAFVFDTFCVGLALVGAMVLRRAFRAHVALAERHRSLLEVRASELEQFAGTIAHDILSPLGSLGFALELAGRGGDETARTRSIARGNAALHRVQTLVAGLLEFARAGAKPSPGVSCEVAPTLDGLWSELKEAAARRDTAFEVDVQITTGVACHPGVLTSIVSNLAYNAIKYIGDGPRRSVRVRGFNVPHSVRFEVQDSGPGLTHGLEAHVFEPYVRGAHSAQGGIGLGLATVKRLVQAHGGKVGVHPAPGGGCVFWFELPAAASSPAPTSHGSSSARVNGSSVGPRRTPTAGARPAGSREAARTPCRAAPVR